MADEPPTDSRTDDRDPTSMTGHAREATEPEVASPSDARQPTSPPEQTDLQSEPPPGARPTAPVAVEPPFITICTCPFCPNPPMADDYPMPVMCDDGTWVTKATHRYCILVECVGQETADLAWAERTRPSD